jgi:hypothetical protein
MDVSQRKRLMKGATVATGLAAAIVLAGGLTMPVRVDAPQRQPGGLAARSTASTATSRRAGGGDDEGRQLAELQRLCSLDLRKPLFGSPAASQAAPAPQPQQPTMTLRLVGLVNEPGHSMAMFQKTDGSIVFCAQGESVVDAGVPVTVIRIDPPKVTVQRAGTSLELALPPPPTTQPS